MSQPPAGPRADQPLLVDVVLAAGTTVLVALFLLLRQSMGADGIAEQTFVNHFALAAPAAILLRERHPLAAAMVLSVALAGAGFVHDQSVPLLVLLVITVGTLAAVRPLGESLAGLGAALLVITLTHVIGWSPLGNTFRLDWTDAVYDGPDNHFTWLGWPGNPGGAFAGLPLFLSLLAGWVLGWTWSRRPWRALGDRLSRRVPSWGFDAALTACLAVSIGWQLIAAPDWSGWSGVARLAQLLVFGAFCLLALRRVAPIISVVALAGAAALSIVLAGFDPLTVVGLSAALYAVGAFSSLRFGAPVVGLLLAGLMAEAIWVSNGPGTDLLQRLGAGDPESVLARRWPLVTFVFLIVPWAAGLLVRLVRVSQAAEVREQVLVQEKEEQEQVKVLLEGRSEIARDLHDVVAHHVNLIVIQAETGPDLMDRGDQDVLQGFQRIGDAGRKALGELDRMLSALRDPDGRPAPELAPQPGLTEVRELVDGLVAQGLVVEYELRGDPVRIPKGVQVTAYRLVQEALTNVVKHATAREARVLVDISTQGVSVAVRDDGKGFDPERLAPGRHGLAGMRERIRVHEGLLSVTSRPGTGTLITAWIPPDPTLGPTAPVDHHGANE